MKRKIIRSRTYYKMKGKGDSRERKVLIALRAAFPEDVYYYLGYYSWLPGVKNEPLQIDILFPELSLLRGNPLAVEVQGDQHRGTWRKAISYFYKNEEAFRTQQENDRVKKMILSKRGIPLLEVWPEDSIDVESLREKIMEMTGTRENA
jgi:hypothetical protein